MLDDIIVWWVGDDSFDVMPNASNTARVVDAIGGVDVTASRAIIAVQGPAARARLAGVSPEAAAVPRRAVAEVEVLGHATAWSPARATRARTASSCAVPAERPPQPCGTRSSPRA